MLILRVSTWKALLDLNILIILGEQRHEYKRQRTVNYTEQIRG